MADFDLKNFSFSIDGSPFGEQDGNEPTSMDEVGTDPGIFLPNKEGRTEFLPPDAERVPKIPGVVDQNSEDYAARPAKERITELFNNMNPHRRVLYGVLREMKQPISNARAKDVIENIRAHKFSVYSPTNICTMLEVAGAVERVLEDGKPYSEYQPEPEIIVEDGVEYYKPTEAPAPFWCITEAGEAQLETYDPKQKLEEQLEREKEYKVLYKRVLVLGSREEGATMKQFSAAVDSDPLVATEPRDFFVQHFVEALERCEAVAWDGSVWRTTKLGTQALEDANMLAGVEDTWKPTGEEKAAETETQGVNW